MDWSAIHTTSEIFQWLTLVVLFWLLHRMDKSASEAVEEIEKALRDEKDGNK